ncbi:MAG: hypothetical protein WA936_14170 [Erythrobacter sp.]
MSAIEHRPDRLQQIRLGFALLAIAILAAPMIAMQFTREVAWGPGDFIVVAGLLAALFAGIELALRAARNRAGRIAGIVLSLAVFLTVWAELAVGIFD